MKKQVFVLLLACVAVAGCATAPKNAEKKQELNARVDEALAIYRARVPNIEAYFEDSVGYAVFPRIGKVGFFVGGTFGRGQLFENGQMVGYARKRGGSLGLTFGGQYFRELIFFQNQEVLDRFKRGELAFTADVTAVAASAGVGAKTNYKNGVAVFLLTDVGLMADASLGGQEFDFEPIAEAEN